MLKSKCSKLYNFIGGDVIAKLRFYCHALSFSSYGKDVRIERGCAFANPSYIQFGSYVRMSRECLLYASEHGKIIIGDHVLIGPRVMFFTENYDIGSIRKSLISSKKRRYQDNIIIESNVWIGAGVIILPGVTLKKGTVVGAGAVVTKSTEENMVIGGVPAVSLNRSNKTIGHDILQSI